MNVVWSQLQLHDWPTWATLIGGVTLSAAIRNTMATCDLLSDALKSECGLGLALIKDSMQMSATFVVHALLRTALQQPGHKVRLF